jgi:cell division protein FtsB
MDIGRYVRKQLKSIVGPTIGVSLALYFGYHLLEGERGLSAWIRLTDQIRATRADADLVHAERVAQDQRISLLRPEHLDPDMLDEQARAALNLVGPGEIVILNREPPK